MLKKIFLIAFIFSSLVSRAQKIKDQATYNMLETAASLLEAQQFEAAEQYYQKGLDRATLLHDSYCRAVAYKGLGNLYARTNRQQQAITSYRLSLAEYKSRGMTVMADIVESLLKSAEGVGELYAGVEVGAKGIKLSVINIKLNADRDYEYSLTADTSINTDAASLSYESEKQTEDAISVLYGLIKYKYEVPSRHVFIVISSGLKQELDRYNKVEYFANVVRPKDLDSAIRISYITPEEEAELSFTGIVPQKNRYSTDQIDVGSGNTKGGYMNTANVFVPVTFPYGTKSFQRLIETAPVANMNDYLQTAEKIWNDSLGGKLAAELAGKDEFKAKNTVYVSGGIVWAIASLMHPDGIKNNYTEITERDISDFRRLIYSQYDQVTKPDIMLISNPEDARASLRNINRVLKTYDQRALLAGAICLDELVRQVNMINPDKKLVYPKYAYVGWISGYILKKVSRQYTTMLK